MTDPRFLQEIKQFRDNKAEFASDTVVVERNLTIYMNGNRLVSIACLPDLYKELALGFLISEGIIKSPTQVKKVVFEDSHINFEAEISDDVIESFLNSGEKSSGCGSALSGYLELFAGKDIGNFSQQTILALMHEFQKQSALFLSTGGVHGAALADDKIVYRADDIGRHNAVDKVIGMAHLDNRNPSEFFLLTSGRISSEIVRKTVRAGIPLIVSHSAPTSEAIRLAWDYKTILIGFARGSRCNVYTFFDRII
ncbi:MAG: formate dehydrogenase accessory sulfurtransferase FdhD [Candidatus Cloacimonetes bacterium]|nr:formate dehydrogenase accessory sulfurtransferase FdhD [Candidatus Cloacimonadota bacterium]